MADTMTLESARQFVTDALEAFVRDPADNDFQRGCLEALYIIGNEALGMNINWSGSPGQAQTRPPVRLRVVTDDGFLRTRMIVCSICGNKRCPHATDHRLECTGSNEPGQAGSAYE